MVVTVEPDWFREISPLSKVPAMRIGEVTLFESAVICEYIDEVTPGSLHPGDPVRPLQGHAWQIPIPVRGDDESGWR